MADGEDDASKGDAVSVGSFLPTPEMIEETRLMREAMIAKEVQLRISQLEDIWKKREAEAMKGGVQRGPTAERIDSSAKMPVGAGDLWGMSVAGHIWRSTTLVQRRVLWGDDDVAAAAMAQKLATSQGLDTVTSRAVVNLILTAAKNLKPEAKHANAAITYSSKHVTPSLHGEVVGGGTRGFLETAYQRLQIPNLFAARGDKNGR